MAAPGSHRRQHGHHGAGDLCDGDRLLGGGVNADNSTRPPQQGVQLRGSYPGDPAGKPVGNGAVDPTTWTGIVHAGGQPTPNTVTHTFAHCGAFGPSP